MADAASSSLFPLASSLSSWTIVLPAFNEEDNLAHVVDDLLATFERLDAPCDVLIVDDGSTDRTPQIADDFAARVKNVRVIHHRRNLGFGGALRTGYAHAAGDLVVVIPTDRQFQCRDLTKCLPFLEDHDVICCVRRRRRDPFARRVASTAYRTLVQLLFGLELEDINWVKIYKLQMIRQIDIESQGPFIDTEILLKLAGLGARIKQVDVPHYPRVAGQATGASLRAMAKTFLDLFHLRRRLRNIHDREPQASACANHHPPSSVTSDLGD